MQGADISYHNFLSSEDNPSVKLFRKLMTSKKIRRQYGLFALEGLRLVMDAFESGYDGVEKLYLTETAYEKYHEKFEDFSTELTVITDALGRKISETENTQGVFAMCRVLNNPSVSSLKKNGRYIVLHKLQDTGNAGMIIRTAAALGLDGVIFSGSCDVFNPKTVRSSMGALFRIPVYRDIDEQMLFDKLSELGLNSYAAVVDKDACDVADMDFNSGGAVFVGNEGNGLDKEVTDLCSERLTIRMSGSTESLNAAMAAGIIMWELMKCD